MKIHFRPFSQLSFNFYIHMKMKMKKIRGNKKSSTPSDQVEKARGEKETVEEIKKIFTKISTIPEMTL